MLETRFWQEQFFNGDFGPYELMVTQTLILSVHLWFLGLYYQGSGLLILENLCHGHPTQTSGAIDSTLQMLVQVDFLFYQDQMVMQCHCCNGEWTIKKNQQNKKTLKIKHTYKRYKEKDLCISLWKATDVGQEDNDFTISKNGRYSCYSHMP